MKSDMKERAMRLITTTILLTGITLLTGCGGGGGGEGGASDSSPAGQTGAIASLAWNPVQDSTVYGYYVHYGKYSPGQYGSCSYQDAVFVSSPEATISNLDPDTRYYFSVSAYNGAESACSSEVSTVTPSSQA
jgi:hypothetical protein